MTALYSLVRRPHQPDPKALGVLNREVRRSGSALLVHRTDGEYRLAWASENPGDLLLGPLARSAVELLTSPELDHVRESAGEGCGWLFLDRSNAHRRRWCSMLREPREGAPASAKVARGR